MRFRNILTFGLAGALLLSCTENGKNPVNPNIPGGPDDWTPEAPACADPGADGLDRSKADLGLTDAVVITYADGAPAEITSNTYVDSRGSLFDVRIDGGHVDFQGDVIIQKPVNIVLSGVTKNGSFKVNADRFRNNVGIYMNGVNITNPNGPALNIQRGGNIDTVFVNLVGGCGRANALADGVNYDRPGGEEQAKGTFFSEAEVVFTGSGSLEVRSKGVLDSRPRHAIVVDNHLTVRSGNIVIHESRGDGIHINRALSITGGTLQIKSAGDAIQNERNYPVGVTGGKLTLWTTGVKSHGIACDSNDVTIGGNANINITVLGNGAKGIRSRGAAYINGGAIKIETLGGSDLTPASQTDDGDTTSSASGVRAHYDFNMSAGNLTVKSTGENSKGINADAGVTVSGGNIRIEAAGDGIKTDGDMAVTGGDVYSKSTKKKAIDCKGNKNFTGGKVVQVPDPAGGGF
jgi:hypothetical protein